MSRTKGTKETSPRAKGGGAKAKGENGNRVNLSVNIDPVILQSIRREAQETGKSLSDVLNQRLA